MLNLSGFLIADEKYEEGVKIAEETLKICRESEELWLIPNVLLNMAKGYKALRMASNKYTPLLIRSYHCANAIGRKVMAEKIKNEAKATFEIDVEY